MRVNNPDLSEWWEDDSPSAGRIQQGHASVIDASAGDDAPGQVELYLPSGSGGHVLMTHRRYAGFLAEVSRKH